MNKMFHNYLAQAICYMVRNGNTFTRYTHLLFVGVTGSLKKKYNASDDTFLSHEWCTRMMNEVHIFHNSFYGTNWQYIKKTSPTLSWKFV